MSMRMLVLLAGLVLGATAVTAGDANAYYDPHTGKYVNPYQDGYHPQTVNNLYPGEGNNALATGYLIAPASPGPVSGYRNNGGSYYGQADAGFPLFFFNLGGRQSTTSTSRTGR